MHRSDNAYGLTKAVSRIALSPLFRLTTFGAENLPKKAAFVLLPKHQRWEDVPLLGISASRPLYYVAKQELFLNPFIKCFLEMVGGIPLNRKRPIQSRKSLKHMITFLKQDQGVVVFPEGTYYKNRMGPPRLGIVRNILSQISPLFVPVGIHYTREKWRTAAHIQFGKAVFAGTKDSPKAFLDSMMQEIARLSGLS